MIVDTHYHYIPKIDEKTAKIIARFAASTGRKTGLNVDIEALAKKAIQTLSDSKGLRLIESMDASGIDTTIAVTVDNMDNNQVLRKDMERVNRLLSEIVQKYPKRVIGLAGIDPRRPEAVDMARSYLEDYGLSGFKYHPDYGYDPAGKQSYRVLEILAKNKGILLTHTSPLMRPSRNAYAEPALLSDIGVDFPEITVIAAHMGGYINWRPWAALSLFQPALYGDLAMWDVLAYQNYELFCRELRTLIDFVGPKKILFGSDAPIQTLVHPMKKWIKTISELPQNSPEGVVFTQNEVDLILGENAKSLFDLS